MICHKKIITMNKFTPSPLKKTKSDITGRVIDNTVTETKFTIIRYDKNSPAALSDKKAMELFSSFTADIIKEETLFTR